MARQWSREKFAILSLKPLIHVWILKYQTWAIALFVTRPRSQPNFGLNPSYQIWNPIFSARLRTEGHCHNEVKELIDAVDWRQFLILLVNTLSLPTLVSITILKPILSSSFLQLDRSQFSLPIYLKLLQRPVQGTHAHAWSTLDGHWLNSYSYALRVFYHKAS